MLASQHAFLQWGAVYEQVSSTVMHFPVPRLRSDDSFVSYPRTFHNRSAIIVVEVGTTGTYTAIGEISGTHVDCAFTMVQWLILQMMSPRPKVHGPFYATRTSPHFGLSPMWKGLMIKTSAEELLLPMTLRGSRSKGVRIHSFPTPTLSATVVKCARS